MRKWLLAAVAGVALILLGLHHSGGARLRLSAPAYERSEYQVPMRDGIRLHTVVYAPRDHSRRYPVLIQRTPYGAEPGSHLGPSVEFDRAGYIFVFQDVRGRYNSEGVWQEMTPHAPNKRSAGDVDESTDMYDSVDWLLNHVADHNGRVGVWGISYPGFYTAAGIIDSHPAIRAASPQAPVIDLYHGDDAYHGGAFMLASNFGFYSSFDPQGDDDASEADGGEGPDEDLDRYAFFLRHPTLASLGDLLTPAQRALWRDQVSHDTYDDYWRARSIAPHLKNVHCAVLTVGGWFDAEDLQGPFSAYRALGTNNPGIYNGLVIGPWSHGAWARSGGRRLGAVDFGAPTVDAYRRDVLFPFFEHYLRDDAVAAPPLVTVFETGANAWRHYDHWPPAMAQPRSLYFEAGHGLSWVPPDAARAAPAFDEYLSDPARPVPYIGFAASDVPATYMVGDQRFAAVRPDVLVYETPPLREDVTVAGPVTPQLYVSSSGTDADWIVKLIDVYPDDVAAGGRSGYQQLVRGGPLRAKFRHSFARPEPLVPGRVEPISFTLPDINHRFLRGHRIMVQVQSSWFPLIDRNPQVFEPIAAARPGDFVAATQRLYHDAAHPSSLRLAVLPADAALTAAVSGWDPSRSQAPAPSP